MKTTMLSGVMRLLIFLLCVQNSFAQSVQMAGRVHPNATILTFKSTYPILNEFREGLCVVNDGSSFGVIDETGAFVIPFGKYTSIKDFENGFLIAQDAKTNQSFALDYSGSIVLRGIGSPAFDRAGYFQKDMFTITNLKGQTFKLAPAENGMQITYQKFSEGLCSFFSMKANKHGYVDKTGKVVIAPQFERATDFSEGFAAIAKVNEAGEERWGFIDQSGKIVIPCQYRNQPGSFVNGLAHLVSDKRAHAWIDKSGQIKFTLDATNQYSIENDKSADFNIPALFLKHRSGKGRALLDVSGNIKPVKISYEVQKNGKLITQTDIEDFNCTSRKDNQLLISSFDGVGLMSADGKILIAPVFQELSFIDPVSNLAKAKFNDGKKTIEGYVSKGGMFMIVMAKESSQY